MDDSGDILILTLLRRWIQLSPIVNRFYLISYTFIIQYVYKLLFLGALKRYWSLDHVFWAFMFVYSKVYVLPVSPSWSVWVRVLCHENLLMISDKTFQCCFLRNGATHHSKSGNIIRMMSTTITSNIKQTCVTRNQNFFQKNHIDLEFQESIEKWG